jgi:hypothetical protein
LTAFSTLEMTLLSKFMSQKTKYYIMLNIIRESVNIFVFGVIMIRAEDIMPHTKLVTESHDLDMDFCEVTSDVKFCSVCNHNYQGAIFLMAEVFLLCRDNADLTISRRP